MIEDVKYPIGKFSPESFSEERKNQWLLDLQFLPQELERSLLNLDNYQLNTPYRDGGWTVQQLVHHVADSHMNAYIRFKLALTEQTPTLKPYSEKDWANLQDVSAIPVNTSITLLHALHERWVAAIKNLSEEEWQRTLYHPEYKKEISLWNMLGTYAWHGKHHTAHINALRERMKWK